MKFVKYSYSADYCGTDEETYAKWDDDATDGEIANYGYEYIKEEDKPEDYKWEDCCKSA